MSKILSISFYDAHGYKTKEFTKDVNFNTEIKVWLYNLYIEKESISKNFIICFTKALDCIDYTDKIAFGTKTTQKDCICFTLEWKEKQK